MKKLCSVLLVACSVAGCALGATTNRPITGLDAVLTVPTSANSFIVTHAAAYGGVGRMGWLVLSNAMWSISTNAVGTNSAGGVASLDGNATNAWGILTLNPVGSPGLFSLNFGDVGFDGAALTWNNTSQVLTMTNTLSQRFVTLDLSTSGIPRFDEVAAMIGEVSVPADYASTNYPALYWPDIANGGTAHWLATLSPEGGPQWTHFDSEGLGVTNWTMTSDGNVRAGGTVRAAAFVGDGSGLINLPPMSEGSTVTNLVVKDLQCDALSNANRVVISGTSNNFTTVSAGSDGQVLKLSGGVPTWGTVISASDPVVSAFTASPVNLTNKVMTITASGDLAFTHTTNRTAGVAQYSSIWIYTTLDRAVTLNTNWNFWGCTATNTARSNVWTILNFACINSTNETGVHVSFDQQ